MYISLSSATIVFPLSAFVITILNSSIFLRILLAVFNKIECKKSVRVERIFFAVLKDIVFNRIKNSAQFIKICVV